MLQKNSHIEKFCSHFKTLSLWNTLLVPRISIISVLLVIIFIYFLFGCCVVILLALILNEFLFISVQIVYKLCPKK